MDRIIVTLIALTIPGASAFADSNYTYLALGDSLPFGMNITLFPPYSPTVPTPADFIGFPEVAAAAMHVSVLNASCPGETSGSFLDVTALDNGCNGPHLVPPPVVNFSFKSSIGLHAAYSGSQMDFAVSELKANKSINLVTLTIGADDGLLVLPQLLQCNGDSTCANKVLSPVLQAYATNLAKILTGIRAQYQGTLMLMTYYSPDPSLDGFAVALNGTMTQVAAQLSATPGFAPITIADGFAAFQIVSASANHNACQAGLLIPLPPSPLNLLPCDIHPSPRGRDLLATLVERVVPSKSTACNGFYSGTFPGNLNVSTGQSCIFVGGGVRGNITQAGGNLILSGTTVGGNVQIQGGGAFSIGGFARIIGNLQVQNLPANANPNQLCGVTVTGNLAYQNSGAPIGFGAATMCPGNTVGGDLQVHNNFANVGVVGNTVLGNVQIQNNIGSTTVSSNHIGKNLQCSGNSTITGNGNTALQKQGQCAAF
jgi:hypothetical protein